MQRSGSQKALLVVSIIEIVCAAIVLILGIVSLAGIGAVSSMTVDSDPQTNAMVQAAAGSVFSIATIVLLVSGGWSLFCGIMGVRAANDNQKIMFVWVMSIISVVFAVISLIMSIVNGTFGDNWVSQILTLAVQCLMFWVANNIKQEAGR